MAQTEKNVPVVQEIWVLSLVWKDCLQENMATYSSILTWRIPRTEETGGLQSMGSQRVRVGHNWETKHRKLLINWVGYKIPELYINSPFKKYTHNTFYIYINVHIYFKILRNCNKIILMHFFFFFFWIFSFFFLL